MHEPNHAPEALSDAGTPAAAEPHARESNMNMDDINIPLVAISVAFFGALLAVTIISLQAWFYNRAAAELQAKTLARDDPRTELGSLWEKQRSQLTAPAGWVQVTTMPASAPATGAATATGTQSAPAPKYRIPIEDAMKIVVNEYTSGGGS